MLQWEHSVILLTFIKLQFVIKIFALSIFEWPLKTGFTVYIEYMLMGLLAYCKGVIGLTVPVNMLSFTIHVPAISTASQVIVQP